ncbi:hypothetical protein LNV23_05315 [Paucibacter sp. DJ1R-11]|uniref:hypothetical protein n=1 Tax=Paucibacter sp. DJ1R-11 TaxID=2893556 RepID=UPI0021E35F1F|nr:hypothetical protein [Paucibacter sp. DJ1R-11]MCV2362869.1 hypothetical protein [Paucibacter sp. DJ1R-11]
MTEHLDSCAPPQPSPCPRPQRRQLLLGAGLAGLLQACGGGGGSEPAPVPTPAPVPPAPIPPAPTPPAPSPATAPFWANYGGNAQHQAQTLIATQALQRIVWSTPVDLAPPYRAGGFLLIHYGTPVISGGNTVLVPVKTTSAGDFEVQARKATDGSLLWTLKSDYLLPASSWTPSWNIGLDFKGRLFAPAAGGRLLIRDAVDSTSASVQTLAFYGNAAFDADSVNYRDKIRINTPLSLDSQGTVFFGFTAKAGAPGGLQGGIVRVAADGKALWKSAAELSGDANMFQTAMNAAPALSVDEKTLYIAVNSDPASANMQNGYLLALDAGTLTLKAKRRLINPATDLIARVSDSSTASPTVGPDGDVFYGVLENSRLDHNGRGWLLHFNADLSLLKTPGSFGWDDTASIVPTSAVPGYSGASSYLLLVKYNNYFGIGTGDGQNKMALLDPQASQADPISPAVTVMKEVLTIVGPTVDAETPGGVREWCVNTAVVDVKGQSALVNNEDGTLYRWDFRSNRFSESVKLNAGIGQAYTPTVAGPDGLVYSINGAQLHAVGR